MIPPYTGPVARLVATGLLVTVAVAASMSALTRLVLPGPWVRTGLLGVVLVAVATTTTRGLLEARARRRGAGDTGHGSALPTLAGALVAGWFVLSRYGAPTSSADLLVGPEHLGRVVARLGEAGEIIRSEVAPVPGTLPMALLTVGGTLAVLLLADALAGGLHWYAGVGLPLLALWAPPLVLVGEVPRGVFVVVVTALLLLLTVSPRGGPRPRRQERPPRSVRRAEGLRAAVTTTVAVVVAAVAGLVATASESLPGYAGAWYQAFTTSGDAIQLAEDLDVLGSLTERSGEVVLTYTGPPDGVGPWRTYTTSAFDGRRWQRGDERTGAPFGPDDLLWPDEVAGGSLGDGRDVAVTVGSLRDDQLPVPAEPRRVSTTGTWGYDAVRDEVVGDRTDEGETFEVTVRPRDLDPERLRAAGPGTTVDAYLLVPETDHAADVADLAREVTGDAPTAYDQAVALQRWLRDPSSFTYSTELPRGGTGDPVWDFLQHRTGYCVQFATTMTMMARTLDIPARLGVGFLPGETLTESEEAATWQVTGQDSHAWPELYFDGVGWVRFEPTPAVQTGAPPTYTTPRDGPADSSSADEAPQVPEQVPPQDRLEPEEGASAPPVAVPAGSGGGPDGPDPWVWVVGGLVLVAAGVAGGVVLRRRRDERPVDAERAWEQVLVSLARAGVTLPPPTTPRQAPDEIVSAVTRSQGRRPSPEVREGLQRIADAVERSRYAGPAAKEQEDEDLAELAETVSSGLAPARRARRGTPSQE